MATMAITEHMHGSSSHTESEFEFPTVTMDYRTVAEIDDAGSVITVDSLYSFKPGDTDGDRDSHSSRLDSSDCGCNSDHDDHGDHKETSKPRQIEINGCKYHPNLPCECINTIIEVDTESNWSFKLKPTGLENKECGCNIECDCDTQIEVDDASESNDVLWGLGAKACGCNLECDCDEVLEAGDGDDESVYTDSNWSYHPGRDKACECNLECECDMEIAVDTQSNWSFKIGDDKDCGCNLPCDCGTTIAVDRNYVYRPQRKARHERAKSYLKRVPAKPVELQEPKECGCNLECDCDQVIEAGDGEESDSDESDSSGAESLDGSVHDYLFENGRRYHTYFGENKNLLPIDELESDRQNLHHEVFRVLLDNRLHLAPLENPASILDIGCGTGQWAMDMAEKYPDCEVMGVDLSPIQPTTVPINLTFSLDDVERQWAFGENKFDFIHIRNLAQGISDWKSVITQAYAALKPGGFIELSELETTVHCDENEGLPDTNEIKIFMDRLNSALLKLDRSPATKESMISYLMGADFINVEATSFKHPFGPWSEDEKLKKVGVMNEENCETMFTAYGLAAFTRVLEMEVGDAVEICQDAYYAEGRAYSNFHVVYAQKPGAD